MKIALIQDQLLTKAGSERVFLYMAKTYPEADLYTLCYNKDTTWPEFKGLKINVHWLNFFIRNHGTFKIFFPISCFAMKLWNFKKYDLIITSSATTAKYITRFNAPHICYCYFPTRAIWSYENYFGNGIGLKDLSTLNISPSNTNTQPAPQPAPRSTAAPCRRCRRRTARSPPASSRRRRGCAASREGPARRARRRSAQRPRGSPPGWRGRRRR